MTILSMTDGLAPHLSGLLLWVCASATSLAMAVRAVDLKQARGPTPLPVWVPPRSRSDLADAPLQREQP